MVSEHKRDFVAKGKVMGFSLQEIKEKSKKEWYFELILKCLTKELSMRERMSLALMDELLIHDIRLSKEEILVMANNIINECIKDKTNE